jgi:hypothetical protein
MADAERSGSDVDQIVTRYEQLERLPGHRTLKRPGWPLAREHPIVRLNEHNIGPIKPIEVGREKVAFETLDIDFDDERLIASRRFECVVDGNDRNTGGGSGGLDTPCELFAGVRQGREAGFSANSSIDYVAIAVWSDVPS